MKSKKQIRTEYCKGCPLQKKLYPCQPQNEQYCQKFIRAKLGPIPFLKSVNGHSMIGS